VLRRSRQLLRRRKKESIRGLNRKRFTWEKKERSYVRRYSVDCDIGEKQQLNNVASDNLVKEFCWITWLSAE